MTTMEKIRLMEEVRKLSDSEWDEFKAELHKSEKNEIKETSTTEVKVQKLLHELGIPAHIKGYVYLTKAILLVIENPKRIHFITKDLYPAVAKHLNTTSSRVERGIRRAIEVSWSRGDIQKLEEIFAYSYSSERGKTTNSEYIAGIAEYIRNM